MGLLLRHSPGRCICSCCWEGPSFIHVLPAFDFLWTCQGRVYSLTLLANFLVGIHFRRDTRKDTASKGEPREPSDTGVVFDAVHGYDTESTSNHARRGYGAESMALTPVQLNYPTVSTAFLLVEFESGVARAPAAPPYKIRALRWVVPINSHTEIDPLSSF
ncbi:hypothetical protein K438DRAFT_1765424 [Mycena galopus ATCC 62051]|nr:hypothetical protein K438DRAFT_1765424 [Mycena galopus ATCC 62051]